MRSEAERQNWIEHCLRVQAHLNSALQIISGRLSPPAVALFARFIEHNELGLALETLLEAADAEGVSIGEPAGKEIDAAATLMEAPAGLWQLSGDALSVQLKDGGLT